MGCAASAHDDMPPVMPPQEQGRRLDAVVEPQERARGKNDEPTLPASTEAAAADGEPVQQRRIKAKKVTKKKKIKKRLARVPTPTPEAQPADDAISPIAVSMHPGVEALSATDVLGGGANPLCDPTAATVTEDLSELHSAHATPTALAGSNLTLPRFAQQSPGSVAAEDEEDMSPLSELPSTDGVTLAVRSLTLSGHLSRSLGSLGTPKAAE